MRRLRSATPLPRPGKRHTSPSLLSRSAQASHASPAPLRTPPPAHLPLPSLSRRIELIVKLGGSALTQKSRAHTVHAGRFAAAMDAMARLHAGRIGFIVVHGAGSFGHFEAVAHGVNSGGASPLGMAQTHAALTHLNGLVVEALVARGVPAVGVSPLLVPGKVRVEFVAALLDRGHVPVLHGDACYAGDGRTVVLSGDTLVASLAEAFVFVTRAVFLSDVPGLLERPPDEVGEGMQAGRGKGTNVDADADADAMDAVGEKKEEAGLEMLVRRVTVNGEGEVMLATDVRTSQGRHDASGGIMGKLAAAATCVAQGQGRVTAFLAGVGTEGAECALTGEMPEPWSRLQCTRVTYEVDRGEGMGTEGMGTEGSSSVSWSAGSRRRSWFSL